MEKVEEDINYFNKVLTKESKSSATLIIISSVNNAVFIHTNIIKEELKQKENEDYEDYQTHNYDSDDNIYDVNEVTRSLSSDMVLKLIDDSANIDYNQSITSSIEDEINSEYSIDCDREENLSENESTGFSSRLKYEKLSHIQIKWIKLNIENSSLTSKELSNKF